MEKEDVGRMSWCLIAIPRPGSRDMLELMSGLDAHAAAPSSSDTLHQQEMIDPFRL